MSTSLVKKVEQERRRLANLRSQEQRAVLKLQLNVGRHRPSSTKSTWAGKQLEFLSWNKTKGYPDDLITAEKFLMFLTEVKGRKKYKRGRKRKYGNTF
jgi:hypothetical protein